MTLKLQSKGSVQKRHIFGFISFEKNAFEVFQTFSGNSAVIYVKKIIPFYRKL